MIRPCLPTLALLLAATAALPALAQHAPRDSAVTAPLPAAPAGVRAQPLASGAVTHQVRLPGEPGQATVIVRSIQPDSVAGNYRIDFQALDVDGDGDVDVADLQQLTAERAAAEYRKVFWDGLALDGIIDQHLATKLLDVAVNAGPRVAATLLQRALNQGGAGLLVDGDLGPKTLLAANTVPSTPQLLLRLCLQQAAFYGACIQRNPGLETFRFGWMRRALWPFESGASAPPEVA